MKRSENEDPNVPPSVELEKFSDVDDAELSKYILNAKERRLKTALWKLIHRDYHKEKKRKRGRDGDVSSQGQDLTNKAVKQDTKENEAESSVANDHGTVNDAMENWTGEEFTFNDDEV